MIKKEENGKFVEEIKFEITLLPLKEMLYHQIDVTLAAIIPVRNILSSYEIGL